jgi:hypothetical protein
MVLLVMHPDSQSWHPCSSAATVGWEVLANMPRTHELTLRPVHTSL